MRLVATTPAPLDADLFLWDDQVHGFGLRCRHGKKSFVLQYRAIGGRGSQQRRVTLGTVGTLTVEAARNLAQEYISRVRYGHDPAASRKDHRHLPTVADLAARYLDEHATLKKKPSSTKMDKVNLRLHILPAMGDRQLENITRSDIGRLHHAMRQTPGAANRVLALLSKMFNLAENWGLLEIGSNPVRGIERYRGRKIQRFLSAEEVTRLGGVLRQVENMRTESPSVIALIRILLYTGARLGEILMLQWTWIDWQRSLARLPDSKTGEKWLYLPPPALAVLQHLSRVPENPYVLPGRVKGHRLVNPQKPWRRIRAAAGLQDVRIHDLRHTYASWAAQQGLSLPMIGSLLGHKDPTTTAIYAHLVNDPVWEAGARVGEVLSQALEGTTSNASAPEPGRDRAVC